MTILNAYALSGKSKNIPGEIKKFYYGTQLYFVPVEGKDKQSFYLYLPHTCAIKNINLHNLEHASLTKAQQRQLYTSCHKIEDERTNMACWKVHPLNTLCTFHLSKSQPLLITIKVSNFTLVDVKINHIYIREDTIDDSYLDD